MICNIYRYIWNWYNYVCQLYFNKNNLKKEILKKGKKASLNGLLLDVSLSFVIMFSKDK